MVVATLCNHKGGTGKTTSALCLAAALGLSGHRVLLVDLDPQAFLSRTLGVDDPAPERSSLSLFEEEARLSSLQPLAMRGFDLLPAHGRLTRRMRRLNKPTDVLWIKETVERDAQEEGAEGTYDVLLFDTAAAVTVYSLNALVASRNAIIPVTPEYQPVVGAEQTYQTTQMVRSRLNPDLEEPHFLLTRVDGRKKVHARYQRYLRERYPDRLLQSVIRTSTALSRTTKDGSSVFDYAPHARGARDYANAADEWISLIEDGRESAAPAASGTGDSGGRGSQETAAMNTEPMGGETERQAVRPDSEAAVTGQSMAGSVD